MEVGVGTGLALPLYPAHCQVTAIDFSEGMLEKAGKQDRDDLRFTDVVSCCPMDTGKMEFDNNVDTVMAAYVVNGRAGLS